MCMVTFRHPVDNKLGCFFLVTQFCNYLFQPSVKQLMQIGY